MVVGAIKQGSRRRLRRPAVLVVDDLVDAREMYIDYLNHVGFAAIGAADGEMAIATARREKPALIVMDLGLPGVDGWKATRILKSDPATADILIVALSGHVDGAAYDRAMRAGCDLFVAKPCLPKELVEHLLRILDQPTGESRSRTVTD